MPRGGRSQPSLPPPLRWRWASHPAPARRDPGRWLLTGASSVPITYWQGLTSDPGGVEPCSSWGSFRALANDAAAASNRRRPHRDPPGVRQAEGYNHIGDPTWNPGDGGRVLLPMECFTPGVGNTCGTGAFGVADPATLGFRYYVKLDPAEIPKAMFAGPPPTAR